YWTVDKGGHESSPNLSGPMVRRLGQADSVEGVVAYDDWNLIVTGKDVPEDVQAIYFTSNAFQFFGIPALHGRRFVPADARDGQDPEPVAVLTYKFWARHYNSDASVVGRTIQLNHKDYLVIGVLPQRFTWMDADVYLPLKLSQDQKQFYGTIFKLKRG